MLTFVHRELNQPELLREKLEAGCERAGLKTTFAFAFKAMADLFGDEHEYHLILVSEGRYASVAIGQEAMLTSLAADACGYLLPSELHQVRFQSRNLYLPGPAIENHLFMGRACLDLLENQAGLLPYHEDDARRLAVALCELNTPETRLLAGQIFEAIDDVPSTFKALGSPDLNPGLWRALTAEDYLSPEIYAWMVRSGAAGARDEVEFERVVGSLFFRYLDPESYRAARRFGSLGYCFACLYRYLLGRTEPWVVRRSIWGARRALVALVGESEFERWTHVETEQQCREMLGQLEQRCRKLCPYLYHEAIPDWPGADVLEALYQRLC